MGRTDMAYGAVEKSCWVPSTWALASSEFQVTCAEPQTIKHVPGNPGLRRGHTCISVCSAVSGTGVVVYPATKARETSLSVQRACHGWLRLCIRRRDWCGMSGADTADGGIRARRFWRGEGGSSPPSGAAVCEDRGGRGRGGRGRRAAGARSGKGGAGRRAVGGIGG